MRIESQMTDLMVPAAGLTDVLHQIFTRAGGEDAEAGAIATNLVAANLAGHDSHGVVRVPRYVKAAQDGEVLFGQHISRIVDTEVLSLVDGNMGFGQVIGAEAVELGREKAEQHGISVIALRRSGHIGRVGGWAEQAIEAGLVSLHFVNVTGGLLAAPFGGASRRLSTSPVCIGVPNPGGDNFVLDFATTTVAEGKVLVAFKGGKQMPDGCLIDGAGQPTNDPGVLYGDVPEGSVPNARGGPGALVPIGAHKGSGLSMACDLLAGMLTGSGHSGSGSTICNGMLSIYVRPDALDDGHGYAANVKEYIDYIRSCPPADPAAPVMIPGDPERKRRAERLAAGLPLTEGVWDSILDAGASVGLDRVALRAAGIGG